jgi:hypothetical protein
VASGTTEGLCKGWDGPASTHLARRSSQAQPSWSIRSAVFSGNENGDIGLPTQSWKSPRLQGRWQRSDGPFSVTHCLPLRAAARAGVVPGYYRRRKTGCCRLPWRDPNDAEMPMAHDMRRAASTSSTEMRAVCGLRVQRGSRPYKSCGHVDECAHWIGIPLSSGGMRCAPDL